VDLAAACEDAAGRIVPEHRVEVPGACALEPSGGHRGDGAVWRVARAGAKLGAAGRGRRRGRRHRRCGRGRGPGRGTGRRNGSGNGSAARVLGRALAAAVVGVARRVHLGARGLAALQDPRQLVAPPPAGRLRCEAAPAALGALAGRADGTAAVAPLGRLRLRAKQRRRRGSLEAWCVRAHRVTPNIEVACPLMSGSSAGRRRRRRPRSTRRPRTSRRRATSATSARPAAPPPARRRRSRRGSTGGRRGTGRALRAP